MKLADANLRIPQARKDLAGSLPQHIPGLDGLRGVAILLVMVVHFTAGTDSTGKFHHWVWLVFRQGWVGVDLFFVLSGFLITGILLDARGGEKFFRNFYMRRVLRIFPLYFGVLFAAFVVAPIFVHGYPPPAPRVGGYAYVASLWLYVSNFYLAFNGDLPTGYFNHFWSLAIEEQFYLFWPALVWLCSPRKFLGVCIAVILGALAMRFFVIQHGFPGITPGGYPNKYGFVYVVTFTRADSLAMGAAVATLARLNGGITRLTKPAAIALMLTGLPLIAIFRHYHGLDVNISRFGPIFCYSILAIFFGSLLTLIVARAGAGLNAAFEFSALRFLGKYSYGMYVFHLPILMLCSIESIHLWVERRTRIPFAGLVVQLLSGMALTIGVAFVSYHLYEKHFLKLKRFFNYDRIRKDQATQTPEPSQQERGVVSTAGGSP